MSVIDDVLENNGPYAASFGKGSLAARPALGLAILTCMDARIDVHRILGLTEGDAHVIRNAGGIVTDDAIRSLLISQRVLGTEHAMVIQHTGCGMLDLPERELKEDIEREAGKALPFSLGGFSDLEANVRRSVEMLKDERLIAGDNVRGFVYDVKTGRLMEVT